MDKTKKVLIAKRAGGGLLLAAVVVGILLLTGVIGGDDSDSPDLPELKSGQVAVVIDVPDGVGDISQADFDRTFKQTWKRGGLKAAPKTSDAQYQQIRDASINDLLDQAWLTGEAAELDITVTEGELKKEFATIRKDQFPDDAAYKKFLKDSGLTGDEVLQRVKLQILSRKIEKTITDGVEPVSDAEARKYFEANQDSFKSAKGDAQKFEDVSEQVKAQLQPAAEQGAMSDFIADYSEQWRARTVCAREFLTERCSNGPEPAENATGATGASGATADAAAAAAAAAAAQE